MELDDDDNFLIDLWDQLANSHKIIKAEEAIKLKLIQTVRELQKQLAAQKTEYVL